MNAETKKKIKTFVKGIPETVGFREPRAKRKVCFVITNRIHYARQEGLLRELQGDPDFELQLVVGSSALLAKYSNVMPTLERRGFVVHEQMLNLIEGGNHAAMAKTAGLAVLELTNTFQKLNPDIVLIRGDRFEQLAAAMTAAYLNKTVAHIEGGDVSGTIDESVRHAITKLAHIHFVTNDDAYRRVLQMGERPEYVFNVGSPDLEFAAGVKRQPDEAMTNRIGVGGAIDFTKPYAMVIQHPVTSEADNLRNVMATLEAIHDLGIQALWFWPNPDAGTDEISGGIRRFREHHDTPHIRFVIDINPRDFVSLLRNAAALVGNSSSGIKEASFFGVPVVNVGTRQQGRLRGENVVDVGYDRDAIRQAVQYQVAHGPYAPSHAYYKPDTSKRIRGALKQVPLYTQKKFNDIQIG
ncbi:UDP-N-acetylglucosamine 2-epimerase (hydrolyzing) [Candidatus Parcubacteria bacterium]|nr:MAG: UDP-N-acetylglucosamine 2-epimerase (hydrolyzing) [Candidatus Parcubacteria bacterium]